MAEWKNKFDEVALNKGENLYCNGKVHNIQKSETEIKAYIPGIQSYDVSIALRNNILGRMKCQCPKAKRGSNCEHMAAVLYAVYGGSGKEENLKTLEEERKSKAAKIREEAIRKIREKEAREAAERKAAAERAAAEEKAREETARKIAQRNAEKAAKRAERKKRRMEAEKAARKAREEEAMRKAQEEKAREDEAKRKAAEAAARKRAENEARKKAEEEIARKKAQKIQEAIARAAKEEAEELNDDGYSYFDMEKIKKAFDFPAENVIRGKDLSKNGNIKLEKVQTGYTDIGQEMVAQVQAEGCAGTGSFDMYLSFTKDHLQYADCRCPQCRKSYHWYSSNSNCAYMAGLVQEVDQYLRKNRIGDATDKTGMQILYSFQEKRASQVIAETAGTEESLNLEPRLLNQGGWLSLSFRFGREKLFVIKNLSEFRTHVLNSETAVYGSNTEIIHQLSNFTGRSQEWFEYINKAIREEEVREVRLQESGWYYSKQTGKHSTIELYGRRLDEFYDMIRNTAVEYENRNIQKRTKQILCCKEANPCIHMRIKKYPEYNKNEFHGVDVSCDMPEFFQGAEGSYFLEKEYLCKMEAGYMEQIQFLADQSTYGRLNFRVGRNNLSEFYYTILPRLRAVAEITEENTREIRSYLPPEVQFLFYLDAENHTITCRLHAKYGEQEKSVLDLLEQSEAKPLDRFRMQHKEAEMLHITMQLFPELDIDEDVLHCGNDEEAVYQVLEHGIETLMEYGEVQCTQRFRSMNVIKNVKVSLGVSVKSGLLNLDIVTEDITREELLDVLKSYRARKKYYRLKDGDFLKLEDDALDMMEELMRTMRLSPKGFVKGNLHLPVYRTLYLDKLLEEKDAIYSTRDSHFREIVKSFKTVNDADYEEPASLSAIMRGYQKKGYRWLRTLGAYQFGGILADDMGLGKTLQAIAVLLAMKAEGKTGTSLIVAPASLVFNWGEEFEKFAPQLNVLLITGSQSERQQKLEKSTDYDVLITSYDLLKRDIALYEDKQFLYEIIDEAQYIKNYTTAAAKAVKVIKGQYRLAMTGTPIENRLSELWSIFDYLMPGFLYSYEVFKKEIEIPIVKNEDEDAMKRLQRMVGTFILRRLKNDVLKDLPDKLEEIRYVKMDDTQQKTYDAQVVQMQMQLAGQDMSEFSKNKLQILAELTRLRQICCDPSLCFENYKGESAKLEAGLELIQSAVDGGHKILLFSQFTTMLDIIKQRLEEQGIPFYIITGATAKEKRVELVNTFNGDSTPVFLISLKAGGVGLNLTGADVVIHYDPWWNLAVQNQATDRAHRIGQTKKVTVYKLIVKHSIEEKIQKLQEAKKDLADQIVNVQTGQLGSMSKEELLELLEA